MPIVSHKNVLFTALSIVLECIVRCADVRINIQDALVTGS